MTREGHHHHHHHHHHQHHGDQQGDEKKIEAPVPSENDTWKAALREVRRHQERTESIFREVCSKGFDCDNTDGSPTVPAPRTVADITNSFLEKVSRSKAERIESVVQRTARYLDDPTASPSKNVALELEIADETACSAPPRDDEHSKSCDDFKKDLILGEPLQNSSNASKEKDASESFGDEDDSSDGSSNDEPEEDELAQQIRRKHAMQRMQQSLSELSTSLLVQPVQGVASQPSPLIAAHLELSQRSGGSPVTPTTEEFQHIVERVLRPVGPSTATASCVDQRMQRNEMVRRASFALDEVSAEGMQQILRTNSYDNSSFGNTVFERSEKPRAPKRPREQPASLHSVKVHTSI